MPSSSEIFHFSPNFDAKVRSTAFLHRHIRTPQMICCLDCGPLVLSLAQSLADLPKVQHRDSSAGHYDLLQELTRERELMLRVPSVRKEFPVESFSEGVINATPRSGSHFAVSVGTLCNHARHCSGIGIQQKVAFGLRRLQLALSDRDHESRENHGTQNSRCKPPRITIESADHATCCWSTSLCSHFDLLTDGRWLQQAGNTPKRWVGVIRNLLVTRFARVGNTSRWVEPTWLNSESNGLCCGTAFDGVARHAKEDPSQGASFPRRMTSAACPSNTKGIR